MFLNRVILQKNCLREAVKNYWADFFLEGGSPPKVFKSFQKFPKVPRVPRVP